MSLITLKFNPEMEEAIITGRKCTTIRDEQKGMRGDIFRVRDRVYRICKIGTSYLINVDFLNHAEGFESGDHLIDTLQRIYPHLELNSRVWIHYFAYVGDWCPQYGIEGSACSDPEHLCSLYSDCYNEHKPVSGRGHAQTV